MLKTIFKYIIFALCLFWIYENFYGNSFWLVLFVFLATLFLLFEIRRYKIAIVQLANLFDIEQNKTRDNIKESNEAILDKIEELENKIDSAKQENSYH